MHVFTSITSNYLPKARVLARSVKQHEPQATFHVLLCDKPPADFDLAGEPFDHLLLLEELPIDKLLAWSFQHSVIELCTAVKGLGFSEIFRRFGAAKVVFLDPDIVVFSDLGAIEQGLEQHSVLLTPHQSEPEDNPSAILDHEVSSLKYGVFNLGFLAVSNSPEGLRFVDWWRERLHHFCYDERGKGLFTDQKWIDLAPAFFPDIGILREPRFNVSTWNINRRLLTGSVNDGLYVNGEPLCFYHFSGVDSGALKVMMEVYGGQNSALEGLRQWYIAACDAMGQATQGQTPCYYAHYSNGDEVTPAQRLFFRYRDLADQYPNPYDCSADNGGFRGFYQRNASVSPGKSSEEEVLAVMRQELDAIHHSLSWRVFRKLSIAYRTLGARVGLQRIVARLTRG